MPRPRCGGRSTPSRQGAGPWPTTPWLRLLPARWRSPGRSATRCPGCIGPPSGSPWRIFGESAGNRHPSRTRPLIRLPVALVPALRQLSPAQRAAVVLHYEADLPVQEVARRMGTSAGAVKVHLFRGRRRLRELLGEEEASDA